MKTFNVELTEKEAKHLEILLSADINEGAISIRQFDLYPALKNEKVDNPSKEWLINWIRTSEDIKNKINEIIKP